MGKRQPKVKTPQTYAEWLVYERAQFETHHREDHVPPVNYWYTPGDQVHFGSMEEAVVEEVLEDGKLIHLSFHDVGKVYGTPYDAGRKPRLVWWFNLAPKSEIKDTHFTRPRIHTEFTQTSLDSLIHMMYRRGLIDSPEYQRGYVWTLEDKQRLVKSIFNRADIGKFLLLEHPHPEYRLEVVDGKQRLGAIREFIEGRFEYEGFSWFNLSCEDKHSFMDGMIQIAKLQSDMVKKSDILWLFLQINRGGVPQTDEHIAYAKALYEQALKDEANG